MRRTLVLLLSMASIVHTAVDRPRYKLFPGIGYYSMGSYYDSWQEAARSCQTSGGHLAIVNSDEEADVLKGILSKVTSNGYAFIGYHDLFTEGEYLTVYGQPLNSTSYTTWMEGKPNEGTNVSCGGFSVEGGLHNLPCTSRQRFICEQELWKGYEFVSDYGYYKLYLEAATWDSARRTCARDGAHLAIIGSSQEQSTLQGILARYPALPSAVSDNSVFLGFHDIFNEGNFLTVFGGPLAKTGYVQWNSGQPRNDTGVNCGILVRQGELSLRNCADELAFFCEHSLKATPS